MFPTGLRRLFSTRALALHPSALPRAVRCGPAASSVGGRRAADVHAACDAATGADSVRRRPVRHLHPSTDAAGAPARPLIAPISRAVLATGGKILWLAPCGPALAPQAPDRFVLPRPDIPLGEWPQLVREQRPGSLVVGDQPVDAGLLQAWREACPGQDLVLVRRGASLDKIDTRACAQLGVRVLNLPGVNAPYVADFVVDQLRGADGALPDDVRVLGCGDVGKALVRKLRALDAGMRITVFARATRTRESLGLPAGDPRLHLVHDIGEALDAAAAVAIALSISADTRGLLCAEHIARLHEDCRLVSVAKPDVFANDALSALQRRPGCRLDLDYGAQTLRAFGERLASLSIAQERWGASLVLSARAATSPACAADLDRAVVQRLAREALDAHVSARLAESQRIPEGAPPAGAPLAHVVGRGLNGLFLALALRQRGYQVQVFGRMDGASHRKANMRHVSYTETTAKPVGHPRLQEVNNDFVVTSNAAGMALLERFLADNPSFRRYCSRGLIRTVPEGSQAAPQVMATQAAVHRREWLRATSPSSIVPLPPHALGPSIAGVGQAFRCDGFSVAITDFMHELVHRLEAAGVRFRDEHLSQERVAALSGEGAPVITAMGAQEQGIRPVTGWFLRMPAVGGEGGEGGEGLKVHYAAPLDVLNVRRDRDALLVSGGQAPPEMGPDELAQLRRGLLDAARRHFPHSVTAAEREGTLEIIDCVRPGTVDGLSRIEWTGPNRILCGATYAGGFTQAMLLPLLVSHMLQQRAGTPSRPQA